MIIVDTNILSEMMRSTPETAVVDWMRSQTIGMLYTTAVSRAEILIGITTLPAGKRREALRFEADRLFVDDSSGRVLAFDAKAAVEFSALVADPVGKGGPFLSSTRKSRPSSNRLEQPWRREM